MIQEYLTRERDQARESALVALKKLEKSCKLALANLESDDWVRTSVSGGPMNPDTQAFDDARRNLANFEQLRHAVAIAERS